MVTGRKESWAINKQTKQPNILIDDRPINIQRWTQAGGFGILYQANRDPLSKVQQGLQTYKSKHMVSKTDEYGVGIVTKQNATKDVPVGGQYMNVKKLKLGKGKPKGYFENFADGKGPANQVTVKDMVFQKVPQWHNYKKPQRLQVEKDN